MINALISKRYNAFFTAKVEAFIKENVFTSQGEVAPIFFLGEENIEKQKQVEKLKTDMKRTEKERDDKESDKKQSERALDDFKKKMAKSIKDLLSSSGGNNPYNNYDKSSYQRTSEQMLEISDAEREEKILDELALNAQKKKKDASQLEKLPPVEYSYPDIQGLTDQVVTLLRKTVISSVIEALKNNEELAIWVKDGLEKHKKDRSNDCLFCGQTLPDGRIQELEGHFNNEYNAFIEEIERQTTNVESAISKLQNCIPPNRLGVYDDLRNEFDVKLQDFSKERDRIDRYLKNLLAALENKAQKPFQSIEGVFDIEVSNINVVSDLNAVIDKHNQQTDNFQSAISSARTTIEESLVAQSLMEYQQKKKDVDVVAAAIKTASDKTTELRTEIDKIEKDIEEHRRPANELNHDIHSYLGRNELIFEVQDNGYQIYRNGKPATDLSEGEKTAIAFLYFLKSLGDKSFSLKDGIVVIDDPVSSLDSNALFHAFGFMRDRTKDAGQLFILTHSHPFFRQVKNWYKWCNRSCKSKVNMKPAWFYMLTNNANGGNRSSSIIKLDSLLLDYESEYHYLFSLVYGVANSKEEADLHQNYHLPNIARRLLESFLAFRKPSKSGGLQQQLDLIDFDVVKKTSILRFLHTHSHAEQISDPEHDPSILIETKQVLNDLLCLMQKEDDRHFDQMKELVAK